MRMRVQSLVPAACLFLVLGAGVAVQSGFAQPATGGGGQQGQPEGQPGRRGGGQPGGPGGGGGQGGQGGRAASVEGSMKAMNRALRELKTTVGDASKKEQSLMAVYGMQAAAASAKRAKPEHVKGDEAKTTEEYRRSGHKLMGMLVELEGQVLDGKTAEATATLAKIEAARDEAHKALGVSDENEGGGPGGLGGGRPPRPSGN